MTALEDLKEKLIVEWDKADEIKQKELRESYEALPDAKEVGNKARREAASAWYSKHGPSDRDLMHASPEEIHEDNIKAADKIIKNLVARVEKKIGAITDYTGVYTSLDNEGFVILNGYFTGENGTCEVRSIRAGGYNIQKRHIRVIVK